MSPHKQPVYDSEAPEGTPQTYTLTRLRDFKPIGASLPDVPEDFPDEFIFKSRIVDAPPKEPGRVSKFFDKLKSASPAEQAYKKAHVHPFEGAFYCTSADGEIIETTVRRKGNKYGLGFGGNEGNQPTKWQYTSMIVNQPGMGF
jgi:hypothetical protein